MIRAALEEFVREVRDGFDAFDARCDWGHWLEQAHKNIVAITIVFCFVAITGSCVAVPITAVMRGGAQEAPEDEAAAQSSRNPWSLEQSGAPARR